MDSLYFHKRNVDQNKSIISMSDEVENIELVLHSQQISMQHSK